MRVTGRGLIVGMLGLLAALVGIERGHRRHDAAPPEGYDLPAVAPVPEEQLDAAADEGEEAEEDEPEAPVRAPGWDISNLDHYRVNFWIYRFQTDKRPILEGGLQRMGRYAPLISEALAERGMPQDLLYLALIESGLDPQAYSRAHAAGIWQFVRETGRRYGLDVNRAVDERKDPVKATDAALRYLADLHGRFGSWYLAAAAYNTGENRVGRIMREARGRERGSDADYYAIWDRLPAETRDYVPLMIAAARIVKSPGRYGFAGVPALEPWSFEEIVARPATPLKTLARRAGTTVAEIKALNPHLRLDRTRNDEAMTVRVPLKPEAKALAAD